MSDDTISTETPPLDAGIALIDIETELRRSYLGYAVSTLVSRALPDVRDGYKPVQRRILHSMREAGITPASARVKCAKVVGDCFVAGTLVSTPQGQIPIEALNIGDTVYTQNAVRRVTQAYIMPPQPLLEIEMADGAKITGTKGQQYKVLTEDLTFVWKDASAISPGDYILSRSVSGAEKEILNAGDIAFDEDAAYLLGFFLADGWVDRDRKRGYDRLSFACNNLPVIEKIQAILKNNFTADCAITLKDGLHYLRVNSIAVNQRILSAFGLHDKLAQNIAIPDAALRSRESVQAAFVSGFMDGDGSIHKSRNVAVMTSISETFLRDMQTLLHGLNVYSKLFRYDKTVGMADGRPVVGNHDCFALEVSSHSFHILGGKLALNHSEKRFRLQEALANNETLAEKSRQIPYLGAKLMEEFREKHLGGGWYAGVGGGKIRSGLRYANGTKIRYAADVAETFEVYFSTLHRIGLLQKMQAIGSAYLQTVQQFMESGLSFRAVKAIREVAPQVTYDIQVETDHEFIANGLLVHNCMGNYHPHGDAAIYGTLVRMAQDFSMRYPLIDPQGNFGSVDGDPPAAYRYTECRLTPIAMEMMEDIDRDTIDFRDNYDQTRREPAVFPGKFPNFLCNGGEGIAVGMSSSVPPHNLREVVDACVYALDHPEATADDLSRFIPGPDFPTSGVILGTKGAKEAYRTGRGRVIMQAQMQIEPMDNGKNAIVITELPYQVNKARLIVTISELVKQKKVDGITAVDDFSDKHGMRMVIELRRDVRPKQIVNYLLKHTAMRQTFGIIMLALVNGQPRILTLAQVIGHYLAHRKDIVVRRTRFDLARIKRDAHINEGLQIALNFLDEIIALIRKAASSEVARVEMVRRYALTALQAEAILNMQLRRIAQLESQRIEDEYKNQLKQIAALEDILQTPARVAKIVREELKYLKDKYGDERKTRILPQEADEITEEDLIPEEETIVTISRDGYIKRVPVDTYRTQKRGGRGVQAANLKEEDQIAHLFMATTTHYILFFTDRGRVYRLKAYEVPETSRQARGQHINNFIQVEPGDKITAILPMPDLKAEGFLLMATESGEVKRSSLSDFANLRTNGLICFDIEEGDSLKWVRHTTGDQEVILVTQNGMSLRCREVDIPDRGRTAGGVRGIEMRDPKTKALVDKLVGVDVVSATSQLLVVSEKGFGKRTDLSRYTAQKRGGRGLITMNVTNKTGPIVDAAVVEPDDKLMVITERGVTIRMDIATIRETGRSAQGVTLINLDNGDIVTTITRMIDTEDIEAQANATAEAKEAEVKERAAKR